MGAVRKHAIVEESGQITIRGLPFKKGDRIRMLFSKENGHTLRQPMKARDLVVTPLVGMWAERTDIKDSSKYARQLREKGQTRRDNR